MRHQTEMGSGLPEKVGVVTKAAEIDKKAEKIERISKKITARCF